MFGFLKKSPAVEQPSEQQQDHLAELSREKITQLEQQLLLIRVMAKRKNN